MDDFSHMLLNLGEVLKNPTTSSDPVVLDIVKDARIQSFLAVHKVFEAAMISLYESAEVEEEDETCECDDVEHGLAVLLGIGILSEDQHKKLLFQREVATFLLLMPPRGLASEDAEVFDECVENINNYYYLLCSCWRDLAHLTDDSDMKREFIDEH